MISATRGNSVLSVLKLRGSVWIDRRARNFVDRWSDPMGPLSRRKRKREKKKGGELFL
jgi:hypothetical protein